MRKGTTSSGFSFEIEEERLNNMELLDALADLDGGNGAALSTVLRLLLTKEQKKDLYDHLRTPGGTVPIEAVSKALQEIFEASQPAKN